MQKTNIFQNISFQVNIPKISEPPIVNYRSIIKETIPIIRYWTGQFINNTIFTEFIYNKDKIIQLSIEEQKDRIKGNFKHIKQYVARLTDMYYQDTNDIAIKVDLKELVSSGTQRPDSNQYYTKAKCAIFVDINLEFNQPNITKVRAQDKFQIEIPYDFELESLVGWH